MSISSLTPKHQPSFMESSADGSKLSKHKLIIPSWPFRAGYDSPVMSHELFSPSFPRL